MRQTVKFTVVTLWILLSRSYDAYCTYLHTPDLSREANPLVSVVGISSWTPLLLILGALTLYAVYAFYVSLYRPVDLLPSEKGLGFGTFAAYVYLGRPDHWTATLYKLPTDMRRLHPYMGHVLTRCLAYAGVVSTLMWLLIRHSEAYRQVHSAALVYTVLVLGCALIIYGWNKRLYQRYLARV
jgi:hypothetical protein